MTNEEVREKLESEFRHDIEKVLKKKYEIPGRYGMSKRWKADVLIEIWGDLKGDINNV